MVAGKSAHRLEAVLDGLRHSLDGPVITVGGGEQHHKEREQKGHEVREGYQPPFVIDVVLASSTLSHFTATGFTLSAAGAPLYPASLDSKIRGLIRSTIESTPSRIISRMTCFLRIMSLMRPAQG